MRRSCGRSGVGVEIAGLALLIAGLVFVAIVIRDSSRRRQTGFWKSRGKR